MNDDPDLLEAQARAVERRAEKARDCADERRAEHLDRVAAELNRKAREAA